MSGEQITKPYNDMDDNFFIEEPQKLKTNFFNKELTLAHHTTTPKTRTVGMTGVHPCISLMMKKPECKLTSIEHIIQSLRQLQHTLDYREQRDTIDWLSVILDEHFIELVKTDEIVDIIDQLSAYIASQCELMREIEKTKCLLKPIVEQLDNSQVRNKSNKPSSSSSSSSNVTNNQNQKNQRIYHTIDCIEF